MRYVGGIKWLNQSDENEKNNSYAELIISSHVAIIFKQLWRCFHAATLFIDIIQALYWGASSLHPIDFCR